MTTPTTLTDSLAGQVVAPCAAEPALFFSGRPVDIVAAQLICAGCPMLAACAGRTLAMDVDTDGVFASVKLPSRGAARQLARAQLTAVAATGKPAPLFIERFRTLLQVVA